MYYYLLLSIFIFYYACHRQFKTDSVVEKILNQNQIENLIKIFIIVICIWVILREQSEEFFSSATMRLDGIKDELLFILMDIGIIDWIELKSAKTWERNDRDFSKITIGWKWLNFQLIIGPANT